MSTTPDGNGGEAAGSLTFDLRGLVWGIESEVALISSLSRRIDEQVRAVNVVRQEVARRLARLDALVEAADDPHLRAWLETVAAAPLPTVTERFPDRLYTD